MKKIAGSIVKDGCVTRISGRTLESLSQSACCLAMASDQPDESEIRRTPYICNFAFERGVKKT